MNARSSSQAPGAMDRYLTDGGAACYAGKYRRGWTRRGTHWRETGILRRMLAGLDPAASVLNLPCGAGRFAELLAAPSRPRVVFADSSQAMLDAAREALAKSGARSVELRLVDVTRTKPAERLDVVVCVRLLHHLDEQAFASAVDFLAASATAAIVCTFASTATWKGFWRSRRKRAVREVTRSPAAMEAAFSARGWRVAEVRRVSALFSSQVWLLLTPTGLSGVIK